ncbi:flavin monoamine oxidase family protein [Chamaesiphon minutus]|uniref:Monoamine oxidase n=1 Tax=Chamaesiphon minutus (strain ATCC 27169 / PCC 6605) TaxID=1173020 RepID=K9UIC9_CHAP6|nr:NAD(P)/FAD-dependent oxidoreductase [Chamaesiphon minutus]AFY93954.1 monoamine oxidase [Chamaesiphon minutus PCC 6605]
MAKTPLIQMLRRGYQIARFAARERISPATALEIWERQISRRRLLQGSLAAASAVSAVVLEHQFDRQVDAATPPVLIVGAGIAGLTAAYYLDRSGVPIRVVEASNRVGGRILSRAKALGTPTTVELGGEFIDSGHQYIRKLAKELGLVTADLVTSDRGLTTDTWFFDNRIVKESELIKAFIPLAKQIDRDVKAIGEVNYKSKNLRARQLDRLSITDYLARYCRDPILRQFIEIAYTNEYGLDVDRQSAINLLLLIGKDTNKIEIFGSSDQRYHVRGGNQQIVDRLAAKFNDRIEKNTRLESIRSTPNNRYRVSLRAGDTSKEYVFDRVILALPFNILRQIDIGVKLPAAKRTAIKEIGYGTNTKVITSYSDKLWRTKYKSNGQSFSDLDTRETWEVSRYTDTQAGLITSFSGGNLGVQLSRSKPIATNSQLITQFDRIFPGVKNLAANTSLITNWVDNPDAKGSYSCYLVGQWTKFAGAEGERVGNLFFVGEHCSIEAQGYMEGGCATGSIAALAILKDLKIKA